MLIFTNGALLVSSAFTAFFTFCCSRAALLELARFLLDARTGGHPTTGAPGDLQLEVEGVDKRNKIFSVLIPTLNTAVIEIVLASKYIFCKILNAVS
jgi:hypothetical protein